MNIRTFFNENPLIATVAAVALLVFAFWVPSFFGRSGGPVVPAFFYDLNTQKLVLKTASTFSPADGDGTYTYSDGEAGPLVRINIYACGEKNVRLEEGMSLEDIKNAGGVALSLQRLPLNALAASKRVLAKEDDVTPEERSLYLRAPALISLPENPDRWVPRDSPEGQKISYRIKDLCKGKRTILISE